MNTNNKEYLNGHRSRLREKYLKNSLNGFHDYEILEFLLTYAIPRKDVKPIAKDILERFGDLDSIFNSDINELEKINGIGESTAIFLNLIGKIIINVYSLKMKKDTSIEIKSKTALLNYLRGDIGFRKQENFEVLFLSNSNKLIKTEILFCGTIDKSAVYPREIITKTLQYNAKAVIFAHNHPSGNVKPSNADIKLTEHMEKALELIDVKLLDHIIVGQNNYFSFLEEGLLN